MHLNFYTEWFSKFLPGAAIVSGLLLLALFPGQAKAGSGTKIAWGGIGNYGFGGYGYGRMARLGYRGLRRGYRYGSGRRHGQFTYNYNRMNSMGSGYLRGGGMGGTAQSSQLWGRAQGRFNQRHSNNELWNRGTNQGGGNLWGGGGNQGRWGSGGPSMGGARGFSGGMPGGGMPGGGMPGGGMSGGGPGLGGGMPGGGMSGGGPGLGGAYGGGR